MDRAETASAKWSVGGFGGSAPGAKGAFTCDEGAEGSKDNDNDNVYVHIFCGCDCDC